MAQPIQRRGVTGLTAAAFLSLLIGPFSFPSYASQLLGSFESGDVGQGGVGISTSVSFYIFVNDETPSEERFPVFDALTFTNGQTGVTYVVSSAADDPDFDALSNFLTDGTNSYIWFRDSLLPQGTGSGYGNSEFNFFALYDRPDAIGYVIDRYELTVNSLSINTPGEDPHGDGNWTSAGYNYTFRIYGSLIPPTNTIIYDIPFESPEQFAWSLPQVDPNILLRYPSDVLAGDGGDGPYVHYDSSTNQNFEFKWSPGFFGYSGTNRVEQLVFALPLPQHTWMEFDMRATPLGTTNLWEFSTLFDAVDEANAEPAWTNAFTFKSDGSFSADFEGGSGETNIPGAFPDAQWFHVRVDVDLEEDLWTVSIDDSEVASLPAARDRVAQFRLSLLDPGGIGEGTVLIDNLKVEADLLHVSMLSNLPDQSIGVHFSHATPFRHNSYLQRSVNAGDDVWTNVLGYADGESRTNMYSFPHSDLTPEQSWFRVVEEQ